VPEGPASGGVVFVRIENGSRELRWARLEDGADRPLTQTPDREESWPYWSQRAGRLVFQVTDAQHRSDLLQWSPDAGESPLVASPRDERWPAWSPTAARLVYAFAGGRPATGLALIDVDTGTRRVLSDAGPDHFMLRPSWAPAGDRLVVQRRRRDGELSQLWLVEPGRATRALTADAAWNDTKARFTRDGARVVFSREPRGGGAGDVWSIALDGGDARVVAGGEGTSEHSGSPSPTRDELAFVSDRSGVSQVWLAGPAGASPRQLTSTADGAYSPRWSPDGELLVVSVSPKRGRPRLRAEEALEGMHIRVIDRQGRSLFEAPGFMPDWMPAWR
jgi:Tol biopolymer transport system component